MKTQDVIRISSQHLTQLSGHTFDLLNIAEPRSLDAAVALAKLSGVVSKLSPLVGNLIEFNIVEFLNAKDEFIEIGEWIRQDPGFPDAIFRGNIYPTPGFEVKAWYPFSTEITARFRDSQNHFQHDQTYVVLLAWLPKKVIYGNPEIIDVCIVSGLSVAKARDDHYHNPPDYLVLEPENTTHRPPNLQQTNTSGHKFQDSNEKLIEAKKIVESWGADGKVYKPTQEYQELLKKLTSRFQYRLDTNFAKLDRIEHLGIEKFKQKVYLAGFHGTTIERWKRILCKKKNKEIRTALIKNSLIQEESIDGPLD